MAFGATCRYLPSDAERRKLGKLDLHARRGYVLGWGGDGVQIDHSIRYLLGYVVLTADKRVIHTRHVEVDERPLALRGGITPWSPDTTQQGELTELVDAPGEEPGSEDNSGDETDNQPTGGNGSGVMSEEDIEENTEINEDARE